MALVALAVLAACGERRPPPPKPAPRVKVLATVNGVPITEHDLTQRARQAVTGGGPVHEASEGALQGLVRDELIRQKAVQLGLDQEPAYRLRADELAAQLRAFERQELSSLFRRYVQEHAAVTDAEARAYFDQNVALIRSRLHVLQIFYKGRYAEIERDSHDVLNGAAFEEVAWRRFDGMSRTAMPRPPWDLGELRWFQLPPSWRGVVDRLEPGQVSGIIKGEGDRYWVIKLAGRTADPAITFETEKERIVDALRQRKAMELYDGLLAELRSKATITYSR